MAEPPWVWRDEVTAEDRAIVRRLCASTGFFSDEEIEIAVQLVEERLAKGLASGYHFLFAQRQETICGYACFGPIAGTESSWDLYWIVVEGKDRHRGIGRRLQKEVETRVLCRGGKRIFVWTSSREQYLPTRRFYERMGFTPEATIQDYYKPGEHLIIYGKRLPGGGIRDSI